MQFDRFKTVRRLWLAIKNAATVNLIVYVDGVPRFTKTLPVNNPASGYLKTRIDLPSGLKGKMFRVELSSTVAFYPYWENSEIEVRDQNTEDGYRRVKFPPPQIM